MLVIPVCRFGELLVATLRLSSENKCHFHYYSHPHGKLLNETNFEKSTIICTDTTAVNCCALERGRDIIAQEPYRSPETVELDEVLWLLYDIARCHSLHWILLSKVGTVTSESHFADHVTQAICISLGRAWASPTLAWQHWQKLCVCVYVCGHNYTVNFIWAYLNIS